MTTAAETLSDLIATSSQHFTPSQWKKQKHMLVYSNRDESLDCVFLVSGF